MLAKRLYLLPMALALSACSAISPLLEGTGGRAKVEGPATGKVASPQYERQLFDEARQLSSRVAAGELTRVQVADRLRAKSLAMVGRNPVDDEVFRQYRQLAAARDSGAIDSTVAQQRMQAYLQGWLKRWPQYQPKPSNPVFTRFMLMLYDMPALP